MNPLKIFKPEKSSYERTSIPSKFFVAIKEPFHIYLEIFDEVIDGESSITTIFKGEDKIMLGCAGTLKECLIFIKNTINE